jgi:hypothetical protein
VVYSPPWDKKRAKTIYKTIDLERSCTVQTRQGMEDLVGDLLPIVQTKLHNLCTVSSIDAPVECKLYFKKRDVSFHRI